MSIVVIAFFFFVVGVLCGISVSPNNCACSECRRSRWYSGEGNDV